MNTEFRRLDVIVRMFRRLSPESQRWLASRLASETHGVMYVSPAEFKRLEAELDRPARVVPELLDAACRHA